MADSEYVAAVHVAGTLEDRADGGYEQRCLRCDSLILSAGRGDRFYRVGQNVAILPLRNGRVRRYMLPKGHVLRPGEESCEPVPVELL